MNDFIFNYNLDPFSEQKSKSKKFKYIKFADFNTPKDYILSKDLDIVFFALNTDFMGPAWMVDAQLWLKNIPEWTNKYLSKLKVLVAFTPLEYGVLLSVFEGLFFESYINIDGKRKLVIDHFLDYLKNSEHHKLSHYTEYKDKSVFSRFRVKEIISDTFVVLEDFYTKKEYIVNNTLRIEVNASEIIECRLLPFRKQYMFSGSYMMVNKSQEKSYDYFVGISLYQLIRYFEYSEESKSEIANISSGKPIRNQKLSLNAYVKLVSNTMLKYYDSDSDNLELYRSAWYLFQLLDFMPDTLYKKYLEPTFAMTVALGETKTSEKLLGEIILQNFDPNRLVMHLSLLNKNFIGKQKSMFNSKYLRCFPIQNLFTKEVEGLTQIIIDTFIFDNSLEIKSIRKSEILSHFKSKYGLESGKYLLHLFLESGILTEMGSKVTLTKFGHSMLYSTEINPISFTDLIFHRLLIKTDFVILFKSKSAKFLNNAIYDLLIYLYNAGSSYVTKVNLVTHIEEVILQRKMKKYEVSALFEKLFPLLMLFNILYIKDNDEYWLSESGYDAMIKIAQYVNGKNNLQFN